jgi:nanoRNase/pAp phosphatase (c-di-AMP/oligoRNAs hydrolase)
MNRPDDRTTQKIHKLTNLLAEGKNLLIILQDNPDPDSIASAVALRMLANSTAQVQCSIAHGGTVGRAENRALVKYLGLNLRHVENIDISRFDLIAMVDTQPGTGNNSLPGDLLPDIIIDHHPCRKITRDARFYDIRKSYGATSTMLLEYLLRARILPDMPVATALLYGIRSDTQDLGRQTTKADIEAMTLLFTIANKRMLSEIQRGKVHRDYFKMLYQSLRNAVVCSKCVLTDLGEVDNPDMIAEVADLLLRDDETTWALCFGFYQNKALISIRTSDTTPSADKVIRNIVARRGTGGGHPMYAGGQILLKKGTKKEKADVQRIIPKKFLNALNITNQNWKNLIPTKKNGNPVPKS